MNPLLQAVEWLLRKIESLPLVELHTNATVSADGIVLPGEEPADMLRLGAAPVGAVGVVLSVGPARVWLGSLDQDDGGSSTEWTVVALASGITGTAWWRIVAGQVHLHGTVTRTAGNFPSGWTTLLTLPAAAYPSLPAGEGLAYKSMSNNSGVQMMGYIGSTGILAVASAATSRVDLSTIAPWSV